MNVKYFKDIDTALLEFSAHPVAEIREISEFFYIDLNKDGNLVNMTIEHAQQNVRLSNVVVEQIEQVVS